MMRLLIVLLLVPAQAEPEGRRRIGMNLSGIVDWSTELPFVDVFKSSRRWQDPAKGEVAVDANHWPLLKPGQAAETLMVREIDGRYPAGVYTATWEGTGRVAMRKWDVKRVAKSEPRRIEAEVAPADGGIALEILESDPKDPVRNVRVTMPGREGAASPFNPAFLERTRPFGVVRFMDWQRTNWSPLVRWSERPLPSHASWATPAGTPVEVMVDLSNALRADPWFCIPHKADDDFVRRFAKLVKERLDPSLKVYVEYSNEAWNGIFEQARHCHERGKALGLSDNDFQAQLRYYSQRAVEVLKLWQEAFGDPGRVVRVLASQFSNAWVSEQVLGWKEAAKEADALAVAPYFGGDLGRMSRHKEVAAMSVDGLLDALAKEIDGPNRDEIRRQAEVAKRFGVRLVAYEGGQHLVGVGGVENDKAVTELFFAANRHPRMVDLYRRHLGHWREGGGGLYVAFSDCAKPSKWGSWGALEWIDQPLDQAPKHRALLDAARAAK
jgi:hypothetical protein